MVVTRPNLKPGKGYVDGKVALVRVQKKTRAIRNSKNRPAGTIVTEDTTTSNPSFRESVTPELKKQFRKYKWPKNKTKLIQADNADAWNKAFPECIEEFNAEGGTQLHITPQPGQSPITNLCDLLTINAIKAYVRKYNGYKMHATGDMIWEATQSAWKNLEPYKLEIAYRLWDRNIDQLIEKEGGRIKNQHTGIRKEVLKIHNQYKKM